MPNSPPAQPPGSGQTDQTHRDLVKWTRAVATFTFFLVVTSGVSDWFIYQQWKVANDANVGTREQLRAVVSANGINQVIAVDASDRKTPLYAFIVRFQNFGGTRTAKFHAWVSIHYFDQAVPNSHDLSKPWQQIDMAESIIAPNSNFDIQPITITQDEGKKVLAKEGVALLWGRGEYADIFQPEVLHPLSLCVLMQPSPGGPNDTLIFRAIPYRNDCNSNQ